MQCSQRPPSPPPTKIIWTHTRGGYDNNFKLYRILVQLGKLLLSCDMLFSFILYYLLFKNLQNPNAKDLYKILIKTIFLNKCVYSISVKINAGKTENENQSTICKLADHIKSGRK